MLPQPGGTLIPSLLSSGFPTKRLTQGHAFCRQCYIPSSLTLVFCWLTGSPNVREWNLLPISQPSLLSHFEKTIRNWTDVGCGLFFVFFNRLNLLSLSRFLGTRVFWDGMSVIWFKNFCRHKLIKNSVLSLTSFHKWQELHVWGQLWHA